MSQDKLSPDNLIIDQPKALNKPERLTRVSITLFFWLCMFYLWQPLISMVAWVFKFKLFYDHMIILGGYRSFLEIAALYLIIIFILGGGLILWAKINQWRFRGKDRRKMLPSVTSKEIADFYHLPEDDIERWQHYKNCTIYFNNKSEVIDIIESDKKNSQLD